LSWVIRSSCSRIAHWSWKSASWIRCLWFPIPPSLLNLKLISSSFVFLFFTTISPIFLEYRQTGYFLSLRGVIVSLPILYPFAPLLILPIVMSFFLCFLFVVFSLDFLMVVFSFFEMYPFSPGKMSGVLIATIRKRFWVFKSWYS